MSPKLWKLIEKPAHTHGAEYILALMKAGYRPCDWNIDILNRLDFSHSTVLWPVPLVRVSLESLGFSEPTQLQSFYQAAAKNGFETVPIEAAVASRFHYDEQPTGEWLRIAVGLNQMIDSDGIPHLPKLGAALGTSGRPNLYLHTYWAYPHAIFHPHNEFVMVDPRLRK